MLSQINSQANAVRKPTASGWNYALISNRSVCLQRPRSSHRNLSPKQYRTASAFDVRRGGLTPIASQVCGYV